MILQTRQLKKKKRIKTKLLNKQTELAILYDDNVMIYLAFITVICSSNFGDYFYDFIPSQIISEDEFALLFTSKLSDY